MRYWGVVPAAGRGLRYAGDRPKQYELIAGAPMLEHSVRALLEEPRLCKVIVAISDGDRYWDACAVSGLGRVRSVAGGATRALSVCRALDALACDADADDWVLVHDAARPCLAYADLRNLISRLGADAVGGILAAPLTDTMKLKGGGTIDRTLERSAMVRALTPQMFRYAMLRDAVHGAMDQGDPPRDEAEAMERAGHAVRFVMGAGTNIKVSYSGDLPLAEAILSVQ